MTRIVSDETVRRVRRRAKAMCVYCKVAEIRNSKETASTNTESRNQGP